MAVSPRPVARSAVGTAYNLLVVAVVGTFVGGGAMALASFEESSSRTFIIQVSGFVGTLACAFWLILKGRDVERAALLSRIPRKDVAFAREVQSQLVPRLVPGETVRVAVRGCRRPFLFSNFRRDDAGFAVTNLRVVRFGPGEASPGLRLDTDDEISMRPLGPNTQPWVRWEIARWTGNRRVERLIVIAHFEDAQVLVATIADSAHGPVSVLPSAFRLW